MARTQVAKTKKPDPKAKKPAPATAKEAPKKVEAVILMGDRCGWLGHTF